MRNWKIQLLIITVVTIITFINIFPNKFAVDDKTFIVNWEQTRSLSNIPKFFLTGSVPEGHEGVYRPIRNCLYAVYYQFFGTNPFFYHLHSLAVHLVSTLLVYFIAKNIFNNGLSAFVVALLFGIHPIHTETITYMATSIDATGLVFFFLSFYLYLESRIHLRGVLLQRRTGVTQQHLGGGRYLILYLASIFFAVLAFFTYEVTLTLPLLIVLYEVCFFRHSGKRSAPRISMVQRDSGQARMTRFFLRLRFSLPYFAMAAIYFVVRFFVLHISTRGPYLADSPYLTFLTMTKVFLKYISLVILPINQSLNHVISKGIEAFVYRDYRTDAITSQSLFDTEILLGLLGILGLLGLAIKLFKKYPIITFGIGWFFIALLPVSEIVPQGSMLNEKFLYLPSFGFVLIVGVLMGKLGGVGGFGRLGGLGTILILVLFYSYLTIQRNKDWYNDITIWSKDVSVSPNDNAYAHYALGLSYEEIGKFQEAIKEYKRSFDINRNFVVSLASQGVAYSKMDKTDKAIEIYKKAVLISPYFWEGHNNLGNLYLKLGKTDLAEGELRQTVSMNPKFLPARLNLENLLSEKIASPSAKGKEEYWESYVLGKSTDGFSFKYPETWSIEKDSERHSGDQASPETPESDVSRVESRDSGQARMTDLKKTLTIYSDTKTFQIEFTLDKREENLSAQGYVQKDISNYGKLVNQGLAKIPNMDFGFVKVWDFENKPKLQFFLFKGNKVIKVVVFPGDSPFMKQFDAILASLSL